VTLTIGSLFSGAGGFDLAFERASCRVLWQVEIDEDANAVLARHWPHVPRHPDVRDVGAHNLEPVDIVVGGFPCQDLSVAGHRAGMAGERSGLWWEFRRILAELRPRWVVIENVPGLLSSNDGRDMGALLGALGDLGFWWAYRVLDAQHFGVAQRRRRVFIVGHAGNRAYPATVLFEPESGDRDSTPGRQAGTRVAALTANGVGTCGADDNQAQAGRLISHDISPTLDTHARVGPRRAQGGVMIAHALTAEGADASEDGTGRGTSLVPLYYSHDYNQDRVYDSAGVSPALTAADSNRTRNFAVGFTNRGYDTGDVTETQRAVRYGALPMVAAQMAVRRLTPTECLRLQGFPDSWFDGIGLSDSAKYRLMGNAVAVSVVEWIARRLVEVTA
jgi:DNA (cytosine-5)-methyltransferase 1